MKIVQLAVENFKRVKAVRVRPEGDRLVQITGRNAQGKSSVLDAVWAALGGKDAAPVKPVRDGADAAVVTLDLGEIRVRRRFGAGGSSTLTVESKEGGRYSSPQAVLDQLVGKLTFDPLAFSRMKPAAQAATLRQVSGYDTAKLDADRKALFDERTEVNRDAKRLEAQLGPEVEAPEAEVSVAELAREHAAATKKKQANDEARAQVGRTIEAGKRARAARDAAKKALDEAQAAFEASEKAYKEASAAASALVDPDLEAITDKMARAEEINAAVRAKRERAKRAEELHARKVAAEHLTVKIESIDDRKATALASAKFPVEGLGFDGDAVTFRGLPLEQSSSAEQLRVGLAIGAALNPKLRVVLVRDGSLLDADSLKLVSEWAEANDMQVLMERVADGNPTGVVIEDGEVVGAAAKEDETPPADASPLPSTPPIDEEFPFC
jgi:hypothetical protein